MLLILTLACFMDTASQVVDRVTDPDKIIHDYEWFHSAFNNIESRVNQIDSTQELLSTVTESSELARMRIDLQGQQQSCRDLVASYNGNASKLTMNQWKGWSLPQSLDMSICQ